MKKRLFASLFLMSMAVAPAAYAQVPAAAPPAAPAAPSAPATASPRDKFAGKFEFGGSKAERSARDNAIDKSVAGFMFATRGIARGRVKDKTVIRQYVGFEFANGNIINTTADMKSTVKMFVSPENGASKPTKSGDDTVQLTQKFNAKGQIVQNFKGEDGGRTNTYTISPDGNTLTLDVVLSSSKLSVPCKFTLTYVRKQ